MNLTSQIEKIIQENPVEEILPEKLKQAEMLANKYDYIEKERKLTTINPNNFFQAPKTKMSYFFPVES